MSQASIVQKVVAGLYSFYERLPSSDREFYLLIEQCVGDFWHKIKTKTGWANDDTGYTWVQSTMSLVDTIGIIKRDLIPRLQRAKGYKSQFPAYVADFDSLCDLVESNFGDPVQRPSVSTPQATPALTTQASDALTSLQQEVRELQTKVTALGYGVTESKNNHTAYRQDRQSFNERISTLESQIKGFYLDKAAYDTDKAALLNRLEDLETRVSTRQETAVQPSQRPRSWFRSKSQCTIHPQAHISTLLRKMSD
jgi:FtsZ-binding cell division protein ZapB